MPPPFRLGGSGGGGPLGRGRWTSSKNIMRVVVIVWLCLGYYWFTQLRQHMAAGNSKGTAGKTKHSGEEHPAGGKEDVAPVDADGEEGAENGADTGVETPKPTVAAPKSKKKKKVTKAPPKGRFDESPEIENFEKLWPSEVKKTSSLWVFLYCSSRSKNVLRAASEEYSYLRVLIDAAMDMDFRILACDPMHDDADRSELHKRLHYLPSATQKKFYDDTYAGIFDIPRTPAELESGVEEMYGEGLGMHAALLDVVRRIECRQLLLLSPNVLLGKDTATVKGIIKGMMQLPNLNDKFESRVFVPRILIQPEPDLVENGKAAVAVKSHKRFGGAPIEDIENLKILSHGMGLSEVQGGRVTLYPRLSGMHGMDGRGVDGVQIHSGGAGTPSVDAATGLAVMLPFEYLKDRLMDLIVIKTDTAKHRLASERRSQLMNEGSSVASEWKNTHHRNEDHPFHVLALERTNELQADVALAMLHLRSVHAAPLVVTYVANSGMDYVSDLEELAAAGKPVKFNGANTKDLFADFDTYLPEVVSTSPALHEKVVSRYDPELLGKHVTLYWDTYCSCTGINIEAINFLVPLQEMLQVRAVANPDCWCQGFPDCDRASLKRLMKPKKGSGVEVFDTSSSTKSSRRGGFFDKTRKTIWVTHKPVDAFPAYPYHGAIDFTERPTYIVGRTMIEVDRISSQWVQTINNDMMVDEIWVPSQFLVDAFYDSGVKESKRIFVIPEPIDTNFYDPAMFAPLSVLTADVAKESNDDAVFANAQGDEEESRRMRDKKLARQREARRPSGFDEYKHLCPGCYRFFTNFKWERRKGWDILLSAYFTTFTHEDNVILFIKTYLYMDPRPRDTNKITKKIQDYGIRMGLEVTKLPKFVILVDESDAKKMPEIYAQMDCFVLPTRGEGWGLPMQEAMAMGLPTIATNWGGNTEFMTEDNSLLIDIEGMEDAESGFGGMHHRYPNMDDDQAGKKKTSEEIKKELQEEMSHWTDEERKRLPGRQGKKHHKGAVAANRAPRWAKPSLKHLKTLMQWVVENPEEAAAIGREGRRTMVKKFSREAVAETVVRRLEGIRASEKRFHTD